MGQVRFRVMNDSFYVLLRSYVRVDGVRVRILDTRIFHEYGTNFLLREFKHQESDFTSLRAKGFTPGSDWMLSATQADEVAQFMPTVGKINEKITF